jgi:uncharacterized membrane protein
MSTTPRVSSRIAREQIGSGLWSALFLGLLGLSLAALLLVPGSIEDKSIAILHGLCSQRPSHSFWIGDQRLPFDARMTGIYGGFLISQFYLLSRQRLRVSGIPSLAIVVALGLFVVAMGLDGLNSLIDDMGRPTLYEPSNLIRYSTGALTGTTLGVVLWLLGSQVLWYRRDRIQQPILRSWGELLQILALAVVFGLLASSGWPALYTPIVLLLVVSAVMVLFMMALILIQLARGSDSAVRRLHELAGPATVALLAAYLGMFALAAGRCLLEGTLHVHAMP